MKLAGKFLAVKNWEKYQSAKGRMRWVKIEVDLEADADFAKLTVFQRGLLMSIWRLRGRVGRNIENSADYICTSLSILAMERRVVPQALTVLVKNGWLIETDSDRDVIVSIPCDHRERTVSIPCASETVINQPHNSLDKNREEEKSVPKQTIPFRSPVRGFNPVDVARVLCDHEHWCLSGSHNLNLVAEAVGQAMLAWKLGAMEAAHRVFENWKAYLAAPEPKRKEAVRWWLSGGHWNTDWVSSRPAEKQRPLSLPERRRLESIGVTDFNRPAAELRKLLEKGPESVN